MDITKLKQMAVLGDAHLQGEIRGVVLIFHGLGCTCHTGFSEEEIAWAKSGWLLVFPYYGPWTWLNRETRRLVDEIVDCVYREYHLDDNIPLAVSGGSMGGYSALLYSLYSKRPINACLALYPVTDMKFSFHEREDVPRTIYHAFLGYTEPLEDLLAEHSTICHVDEMPDIPYLILHGFDDDQVSKTAHSDPFVSAMKKAGRNIGYIELENYGHGGPLPAFASQRIIDFLAGA